jgi:hypothetical protein
MSIAKPYQPLLFRLIHNLNGLLVLGALITGFWVYNTYDGRFGKLPLPPIAEIIDIHGTIAVFFFFFLPVFLLYSLRAGQHRLIQPHTMVNLSQGGQFAGQTSLSRLINTLMLFAAVFAAITGRLMREEWLPKGELNHTWYSLHLMAWFIMLLGLAAHVLALAKVGGGRLLSSLASARLRPEDHPRHWPRRLNQWIQTISMRTR